MSKNIKYEGAAFVAGVAHYEDENLHDLNCPVKDAEDLAAVLDRLKYDVVLSLDESKDEADDKWTEFKRRISKNDYDTAIVFFSGHGAQINESECLMLKNAIWPTDKYDNRAKGKSLLLKDMMNDLDDLEVPKKIFIIDACRTKIGAKGAMKGLGIRPAEISRQSFVSYATANGEQASDGAAGGNSVFTEALLKFIEEENLPIEQLFKKVRLHLVERAKEQIPWEHTCLIAEFAFNHGQLSKYYGQPYPESAFKCAYYKAGQPIAQEIISGLKSGVDKEIYGGIAKFLANYKNIGRDELFVIGRYLSQVASTGHAAAMSLLGSTTKVQTINTAGESDFLSGLFYQLYFDGHDSLKEEIEGTPDYLDAIEKLRIIIGDQDAETFIKDILGENIQNFNYRIGDPEPLEVNLEFEDTGITGDDGTSLMLLKSVECDDARLDPSAVIDAATIDYDSLRENIVRALHAPRQRVKIHAPSKSQKSAYTCMDFDMMESDLNSVIPFSKAWDIDTLSSNSYVEEVTDVTPLKFTKEYGGISLRGNCTITVHMEFDREDMPSMSFPSEFDALYLFDGKDLEIKKVYYSPDVSGYYR